MINGIDVTIRAVKDVSKTLAFYRDVLGLPVDDEMPGFYGEVEVGGSFLGFIQSTEQFTFPWKEPAGTTVLLNVNDVHEAKSALEAKGVTFPRGVYESPACWIADFDDPDGHGLALHQKKPRNGQ